MEEVDWFCPWVAEEHDSLMVLQLAIDETIVLKAEAGETVW